MEEKVCCFTGHRPQGLPWGSLESGVECENFKLRLKMEVVKAINVGYTKFICGGAMGVDLMAGELVLSLKNIYPSLKLSLAIPCIKQDRRWSIAYKLRYSALLANADEVKYTHREYTPYCMYMRNVYMVESSSLVIAVWNGKPSGTLNTINFAKNLNKQIIIITPK